MTDRIGYRFHFQTAYKLLLSSTMDHVNVYIIVVYKNPSAILVNVTKIGTKRRGQGSISNLERGC